MELSTPEKSASLIDSSNLRSIWLTFGLAPVAAVITVRSGRRVCAGQSTTVTAAAVHACRRWVVAAFLARFVATAPSAGVVAIPWPLAADAPWSATR